MPLAKGSRRHGYKRSVATEEVRLFCGWNYIFDLVKQIKPILNDIQKGLRKPVKPPIYNEYSELMHKAGFAVFFLTGARAREILGDPNRNPPVPPLSPQNFRLDLHPNLIYVVNMPILKRWRKVEWEEVTLSNLENVPPSHRKLWHYDKERKVHVKKKYVTKILPQSRNFIIRKDEPLAGYLLEWIQVCRREGRTTLLDGDYYYWYWFFRQFDVLKEKYEPIVKWRHIYPHWFRAQRASQLAIDYGYDLHEVGDWGGWRSLEVVRQYVGTSEALKRKMLEAKPSWLGLG